MINQSKQHLLIIPAVLIPVAVLFITFHFFSQEKPITQSHVRLPVLLPDTVSSVDQLDGINKSLARSISNLNAVLQSNGSIGFEAAASTNTNTNVPGLESSSPILKFTTNNSIWSPAVFRIATDYKENNFELFKMNGQKVFTVRVRGTNLFITTTNEVSIDQYWGPDDVYEIRFWPPVSKEGQ